MHIVVCNGRYCEYGLRISIGFKIVLKQIKIEGCKFPFFKWLIPLKEDNVRFCLFCYFFSNDLLMRKKSIDKESKYNKMIKIVSKRL